MKEDEADELESDEGRPLAKKVKTEKRPNRDVCIAFPIPISISHPHPQQSASAEDGTDVVVRCTSDGDKYIDLGKKKRATVRSYKGNVFVDIREFYGADGDEKPGKKGVSLNLDQVRILRHFKRH